MQIRLIPLFALAAATLVAARPAAAQDGPRVATVSPARVFNEMQETKDLKQKMEADRKAIEDEEKRRVADVEQARKDRALFTDGSEEFSKKNRELIEKAVSLQAWRELIKQDLARQQKNQMASLFKKIEDATREVAEAKRIDLVLVQTNTDLPQDLEQLNVDQVRGLINQRTVLFNNGKFDVTNDVLTAIDAKYKSRK